MTKPLISLTGHLTVPAELTKAQGLMDQASSEMLLAKTNPNPSGAVPHLTKAVEALAESNKLLFRALFRDQL